METMELSQCTPWQYCRVHGLNLPICSTGHARSRRQASARRGDAPLYYILVLYTCIIYVYHSGGRRGKCTPKAGQMAAQYQYVRNDYRTSTNHRVQSCTVLLL